MGLRWGIGLPGPFYLSGRVFPRLRHHSRRRSTRTGHGFWWTIGAGFFWVIFICLMIYYWMIVGFISLGWWTSNSIRQHELAAWPMPADWWWPWSDHAKQARAQRAAVRL